VSLGEDCSFGIIEGRSAGSLRCTDEVLHLVLVWQRIGDSAQKITREYVPIARWSQRASKPPKLL
jgi:hypothetical protein